MRKRLVFALTVALAHSASAAADSPRRLTIFADVDDDDDDGRPDGSQEHLAGRASRDVTWLDGWPRSAALFASPQARLIVDRKPWPGAGKARGRLGVQGTSGGSVTLDLGEAQVAFDVVEPIALDGAGARVDLATSHAAISRRLPQFLGADAASDDPDPDAVRWLFTGPPHVLPEHVELVSVRPDGARVDRLERVVVEPVACPLATAPSLACRATALIRALGR